MIDADPLASLRRTLERIVKPVADHKDRRTHGPGIMRRGRRRLDAYEQVFKNEN